MKSVRIILIICLLAMTVCIAQPTYTAYATPPATGTKAEDFEVTNYILIRPDGSINTGNILKGDLITVRVDIYDQRRTDPSMTPRAALNTASFSLYSATTTNIDYAFTSDPTRFTVIFYNAVYSGVGKSFNFDLSYPGSTHLLVSKDFDFNQCVPYEPPKDDPNGGVVVKGTGFVLQDARYGNGGTIYAGEPFGLSATILATNGSVPVENVTVSFVPPEKLTISEGSSVTYIGTMSPGQSVPVSVSILPGANIDEGTYTVGINISGINQKTGDTVSAQATVSVPILQPERFEIFNTQLPTDLTAGMDDGFGYSSITLVNKGRGTVANVSVEITGEGLYTDEGKQYIGNVSAGEQKSADFNIHADMAGQLSGMVVVTYENTRGEEKVLERGFSVNVMDFMPQDFDQGFPIEEFPEPAGPQRWIIVLIIVAAAIAATVLLLHRARKKKKAKQEDFLDDDDDL